MMSENKLRLIGFAGRKRSGKTTLAKYLKNEENAIIITIADFLKYLCCDLMNMSYEELNEKTNKEFNNSKNREIHEVITKDVLIKYTKIFNDRINDKMTENFKNFENHFNYKINDLKDNYASLYIAIKVLMIMSLLEFGAIIGLLLMIID